MARQERHARHAGAGHAQIHAQRHARAARAPAHGHRHHHANTTTAITTNTTTTTTSAVTTATATTTTTATNATTQKSPAPASGSKDPFWDLNGTTAGAGTTPTGTWSTGVANWNPSSAGTSATAVWNNGDAAVFSAGTDATGSYTVTVSGAVTTSGITFEEGTVTLAGTATPVLTISGVGGITINSTINGTTTFGSTLNNVILSADQNWANNSSQAFNIASGVQASGTRTLTLNGSGSGGATFSGVLSGALSITVNTTGGVSTFSNTGSTYSGQLTVQSGTLKIDTANNVSSNGELGNSASSVILGGSGTTGTLEYTGATASSSKPFTMATGGTGVFQIDANTLTLSGAIGGSGALTKTGTGTLTLSNTGNSWAGDTTINAGTILLGASNVLPNGVGKGNVIVNGSGTLNLDQFSDTINGLSGSGSVFANNGTNTLTLGDNNATSTFSGSITEGGQNAGLSLTKIGTGTQTLSGANNYSGLTTVSVGVLNIQNATALGATGGSSGTTVTGGAALQIQGGIAVGAEALTLNGSGISSDGALRNITNNNSWSGNLTLGSASTIASDSGTLTLSGTVTNCGFLLTVGGAGNVTASGVISGTGGLTKNGAGTLTLSGGSANTYSGLTTVSAGELDLGKTGSANAIGSGGLTISGGTVKYTGASTDEIANTANVTISGGTLDLNNHADTIGSLTFNSGTLQSTGGTQTLTLAGSTATTLQMQGAATIPTSVNIAFSSTTTSGVGMTFDATNNGTATINGNINLNSSATTGVTRTLTINNGSAAIDTTISGVISNTTSTALTKAGTGTLVLSGANTYGGATTVNAGSLLVYNTTGSGTGTGSITVNNSGTTFGGGTTTGVGGVSGSVNVAAGANIAPSNSSGATGILSTGALTLASTSNYLVDINGTTVGTGFDQLKVTGGASIAGSNLLVSVGAAFIQSDVGDKFAILSNVSAGLVSGTFSGLSEGASFNSGVDRFMITYVGNAGDGTNGNDIILTLTAVPEPSTWLAAALALGAVGYMQRRRLRELVCRR